MTHTDLYLISGATGKTGMETVKILRAQGERVRAMVHTRDARSQYLEELGAEVVVADLLDFGDVSSAMSEVTSAYFCYPIDPGGLLEATAMFAQAASEAGLRSVVNMSQISARREAKSHAAQQHWLSERLWDRTAVITTHLRPTFFADWLAWQWSRCGDHGTVRLPFADGRHAPITSTDQGRVIAAILTNPAPHDRQIYPLRGPEELNHWQIAEKMSSTLGIPVKYEPVEIADFERVLAAQGGSPFLIQHLANVAQDYRDGIFSGSDNLVEVLTGRPAMTVDEFTDANRKAFEGPGQDAIWARIGA